MKKIDYLKFFFEKDPQGFQKIKIISLFSIKSQETTVVIRDYGDTKMNTITTFKQVQ
jgi:hypothetical protein